MNDGALKSTTFCHKLGRVGQDCLSSDNKLSGDIAESSRKKQNVKRWHASCSVRLGGLMTRLAYKYGALLLLLGLHTGCGLGPEEDAATRLARNSCEESSECRGGYCSGQICRARSTALGALLLQITPAAGTPIIAGVGFTNVIQDLNFDRGPTGYEVSLGHVSRLVGAVRGRDIDPENCVADASIVDGSKKDDGSIGARLTLFPRTRLLGLANPSRTIEVGDVGSNSYELALSVPPGRYDIYVEPQHTTDGCVRPPYLAVDQEILPGEVKFTANLPQPEALDVRVHYPRGATELRDWTIEVIDRVSGRRISNQAVLGEGKELDGRWEYTARVAFSQVAGGTSSPASELVRLSPPQDTIGPQVYVERSVVQLFQDGDALIDQLTELPAPVKFSARIASSDATEPVSARVIFLATGLASTGPGTLASFSQNVETDKKTGFFDAQLLPGRYRVLVEPRDEVMSPVETELTVSAAPVQAGKTISVFPRRPVTGRLEDFHGNSISGVPVVMTTSVVSSASSVVEMAQGLNPFLHGATTGVTESSGDFNLLADVGVFNVSSRAPSNTGYPWQVKLMSEVNEDGLNLGRLRISLPVVVDGRLNSKDLGDVVPQSLIVAYALLKDGQPVSNPDDASQVIAVAETRSDAGGQFRLLLPSLLD